MSSTSHEVCELWDGQSVVKVMSKGPTREFIILQLEGHGNDGDGASAQLTGPAGDRRRSDCQPTVNRRRRDSESAVTRGLSLSVSQSAASSRRCHSQSRVRRLSDCQSAWSGRRRDSVS